MTMTIGEQIVAIARTYRGVPFCHAGRDRFGVDCAGVVLAAWREAGLTDWDDRRYAPGGDGQRLSDGLARFCERIDITGGRGSDGGPHEPGDLLLIAIRRQPIHLAIASGQGTMLHALEDVGRVVEVPLDSHWQQRVVGVWRWRGCLDEREGVV